MSSCFFGLDTGLSNKRWNRDVKIPEMTPPLKWWLRHKLFCVLPFCNYLQVSFKDEPTSTNVMLTSRLVDMHSNMVTFKSRTYNSTNLKVCKHVLLLGKLFLGVVTASISWPGMATAEVWSTAVGTYIGVMAWMTVPAWIVQPSTICDLGVRKVCPHHQFLLM